jgi:hypothetical protein
MFAVCSLALALALALALCTGFVLLHAARSHAGPIPPNRGVRRGGASTRRGCDTSLKNSKSAIKLLQVVLASDPTAKTRVFAPNA